jgi:hypothetical protein
MNSNFSLGRECFADVDYNDDCCPILPLLLDIIKTYSEDKARQPTYEPIARSRFNDFDPKEIQPVKPITQPPAAPPSPQQIPPTSTPSTNTPTILPSTANQSTNLPQQDLPQIFVPGEASIDNVNKEIPEAIVQPIDPLPLQASESQGPG